MQARCLNSDHLEYLPVRLQTHKNRGNKATHKNCGRGEVSQLLLLKSHKTQRLRASSQPNSTPAGVPPPRTTKNP